MKTIDFACRAALTGIAGAVLVALAAGPAVAGHGHDTKQHPLRGDFPTATDASASAALRKAAEVRSSNQAAKAGDWLRGDFPKASRPQFEPVVTAASGIDEIWKCSLDQASAEPTKIRATQAVMRVIKQIQ